MTDSQIERRFFLCYSCKVCLRRCADTGPVKRCCCLYVGCIAGILLPSRCINCELGFNAHRRNHPLLSCPICITCPYVCLIALPCCLISKLVWYICCWPAYCCFTRCCPKYEIDKKLVEGKLRENEDQLIYWVDPRD